MALQYPFYYRTSNRPLSLLLTSNWFGRYSSSTRLSWLIIQEGEVLYVSVEVDIVGSTKTRCGLICLLETTRFSSLNLKYEPIRAKDQRFTGDQPEKIIPTIPILDNATGAVLLGGSWLEMRRYRCMDTLSRRKQAKVSHYNIAVIMLCWRIDLKWNVYSL